MYGLAFDVQALAKDWLLVELEARGVTLCLGAAWEVQHLLRDPNGRVRGVRRTQGATLEGKHILVQPGAYMHPKVLQGTAAHGQLAGVKGLWLRIRSAHTLFGAMPRPSKIHGGRYPVNVNGQRVLGQICDLNVMPKVTAQGGWELVIGSGYVFVGMYPFDADRDRPAETLALRAFAQVVKQVYNLDFDIDRVLANADANIDRPAEGCVRAFSPDDRELRVLEATAAGGVMCIEGGGNTGSTTKAPFIASTLAELLRANDAQPLAGSALAARYEALRRARRRSRSAIRETDWQQLEEALRHACHGYQ